MLGRATYDGQVRNSAPRLAATLLLAASVLTPAARPATAGEVVMVDGHGNAIGTLIESAADPSSRYDLQPESLTWISMPIDGAPTRLLMGESGPWDTKDLEPLRYENADCTGDALIVEPDTKDSLRPAAIFDTMVFLPAAAAQDRVVRSEGWPQRDGDACDADEVSARFCCAPLARPRTVQAAPVTVIDIASLGFTSPFRVARER